MRADHEDRQIADASKLMVQQAIAKALNQEQIALSKELAVKSATITTLQTAYEQAVNQLAQKFDVMTQTMTYNPTESSVNELMRSQNHRGDISATLTLSALLNELSEAQEFQHEDFEYVDALNEGSSSSDQLPISSHGPAYGSNTSPSDAIANYHMGLADADIWEFLHHSDWEKAQ